MTDRARLDAVVEHDRWTERGQVFDGKVGNLALGRAARHGGAIDAVLPCDVFRPPEPEAERAESPLARLIQRGLPRARQVHRRMGIL